MAEHPTAKEFQAVTSTAALLEIVVPRAERPAIMRTRMRRWPP